MAKDNQKNRAGNHSSIRSGNRATRSINNNPEGRNQYNSGFLGIARERPVAAAAAAAGVAAAGVFLWSRRSQISEQLSNISDQIGEWAENREFETADAGASFPGGSSGEFIAGSGASGTAGGTTRSGRTTSSSTRNRP